MSRDLRADGNVLVVAAVDKHTVCVRVCVCVCVRVGGRRMQQEWEMSSYLAGADKKSNRMVTITSSEWSPRSTKSPLKMYLR